MGLFTGSLIKDMVMGVAEPFFNLIDNLHTSDEERLTIKQKAFELQVSLFTKAMEYENSLMQAQSAIIVAEAKSESWITRSWRPIIMLSFGFLVVNRWTGIGSVVGLPPLPVPPEVEKEMWTLLQLGLGGYVAGRSVEKIVPAAISAWKSNGTTNP